MGKSGFNNNAGVCSGGMFTGRFQGYIGKMDKDGCRFTRGERLRINFKERLVGEFA